MSVLPATVRPKAIFVPSGDAPGRSSLVVDWVRLVWPLPSGFMAKISQSPVRSLAK